MQLSLTFGILRVEKKKGWKIYCDVSFRSTMKNATSKILLWVTKMFLTFIFFLSQFTKEMVDKLQWDFSLMNSF